ncbi:LOW QUALITY PROTEIN: hypothetical protein OSB04_019215 [Centaurea solstitialis]|uniref:Integrase catalytic domain-containing protein n=1 Tax=Centaurea solstitialis TaxID=347529 RepID=A0AA38T8C5_9ASTR|nr:LOW QUALITY PROTEIN: hypothetical protein OSB04_019215 [Centaurea solstitialis]
MIKNVLSFDLLVDQGFYYKYDYKMISVFKDNIFYFKATPVNGLYTVNLQDSSSEIYHISKRSKDIEDQTYLWHCRLGHINKKRVELLLKGGFLGTFNYKPFDNCESCLSGKMTKQPFNKENERATDLLEIIHTDVCGPFSHVARGGYRYFITVTNDFSRYGYVYLMRHKSESFERFKEFQNEVQNQLDRKIKFLRSDRGGEYLSDEFDNHLMECGIVSQLTPPYTPQMNGVKEKSYFTRYGTIDDVSLYATSLILGLCARDRSVHTEQGTNKIGEKTPYEIWKGKKPKLSFLKIWGCEVFVRRPTSENLKPKSDVCIFVGYPKATLGYYFYNPNENKVFVARNGEFLEEKFLSMGDTRKDVDLQIVDENNTTPTVEPEIQPESVEPQSEPIEEVQTQDLRRSSRVRQEPDRYLGFLITQGDGDLNEPTSYGEAVSGSESEQWQEAMKAEMQSMYDNLVWKLTDLPQHCWDFVGSSYQTDTRITVISNLTGLRYTTKPHETNCSKGLGLLPGLLEIDPPVNDQTEFPLAGSNPETLHEQTVREEHDQSETKPDLGSFLTPTCASWQYQIDDTDLRRPLDRHLARYFNFEYEHGYSQLRILKIMFMTIRLPTDW